MAIMDTHSTEHLDEGVVSVILMFQTIGIIVGLKRIRRLLRLMGRETIFRRKNLTKSGLKKIYKALSAMEFERYSLQSGMVHGYHIYSYETWVSIPDGVY